MHASQLRVLFYTMRRPNRFAQCLFCISTYYTIIILVYLPSIVETTASVTPT